MIKAEKACLAKEFELNEAEQENKIRREDIKLQAVLDELSVRCKGYKGQVSDLVKPI